MKILMLIVKNLPNKKILLNDGKLLFLNKFFNTNLPKFWYSSTAWIFKLADLLNLIFFLGIWIKLRVLYYTNNWVYSTNHKRIAVNYFWFVILAGIVGMVLATVIRLELAYPGVGIFAGDSLQYLSIVTAHGVIMVFFMIMPLLAGAFGNFLLPTQLGVHDVAFPRLNSAAFWFLPAGLIMLANLVCVDRRYQRMNCFNIREVESLLKKKFFVDLADPHEFTSLIDSSMIGLKYKFNDINYLTPNAILNYKWGLLSTNTSRTSKFLTTNISTHEFYRFNINLLNNINVNFNSPTSLLSSLYIIWKHRLTNLRWMRWDISSFYCLLHDLLNTTTLKSSYNFFFTLIPTIFTALYNLLTSIFINFKNEIFFMVWAQYDKHTEFIRHVWHMWNWNETDPFSPHHLYFWWVVLTDLKWNNFKDAVKAQLILYFNELKEILDWRHSLSFYETLWPTSLIPSNFNFKILSRFTINTPKIPTKEEMQQLTNDPLERYELKLGVVRVDEVIFKTTKLTPAKSRQLRWLIENMFSFQPSTLSLKNNMNDWKTVDFYSVSTNFNIAFFYITYFPVYLWNLILNMYDFKNMSIEISNMCNYLTQWVLTSFFDVNFFFVIVWNFYSEKFNFSFYAYWVKFIEIFGWFLKGLLKSFSLEIYTFLHLIMNIFYWIFNKIFVTLFKTIYSINFSHYYKYLSHWMNLFYPSQLNANLSLFYRFFYNHNLSNKLKKTSSLDTISNKIKNDFIMTETTNNFRFSRFSDPVFKYDYKSGDYFPKIYKEVYKHLFVSVMNITNGLKTSPWFRHTNVDEILDFLNDPFTIKKTRNHSVNFINEKLNNIFVYYSFFFTQVHETNIRWINSLALNQKIYNMFLTSSMQQRIYNNWRQLKFTREAWRCKMLSARHQKTLFRRYVHEDGVFWSIERNAKDLLPGWAMITPFSSRVRFTAIGKVDIGLMGVLLVLNSSIISGANFLVTYRYLSTLNNRKMRDARSFFTEGIMVTSWMMILANPMLVIGIIMLLSDRHWQTSFFDYSGGGDTVLFQHMFWFFGHPEVYIIMIPVFGFTNTILSYYLRKRVSARASLIYSMYTIAFLGFFVWGHHMYMVGLAHTTRMLFSTLTVMISVPAATKLMHWCVTLVNSTFVMELPLLFILTFIFFFVSGGISGMYVAHTGMDILFHDTFYVIGHFHVMLAGGAMFGSFGAFYFYFPAIFGVKYSRIYAYLHYTYYLIGQLMTLIPMFWLGYAGMPRRVLDYPASLGGWHSVISAGHMLSVAGLIAFFIMIFDSIRQGKAVVRNTYGISRFNTRLNFYLYESARLLHVQRRNLFLFKPSDIINLKLNNLNFTNYEHLETTLMSYTFYKKHR